jgi:putative tryptophan/tyrosine transport system substrate-binding protein
LADFAHAGGLVAYAIALAPSLWSAAEQVDRVFRGASPADLPVIVPSKYELIVNLRTAKALGFTMPQEILLRADKVIE